MRLLVTTQAVDLDDPVLGFFHAWIAALAKQFDQVHVICLKEGRHELPANVRVHSLGKERGRSRFKYLWRFYRTIYALRHDYDSVFVHMNSEYVCLGGMFWKQWSKRIVLWRNHKLPGFSTWIAVHLADAVCHTSASAYVSRFANAVRMPVGIDTALFAPPSKTPPPDSILFFGRLDEIKHPEVFVAALTLLHERGVSFRAEIVGSPTYGDSDFTHALRNAAAVLALDGSIAMRDSVNNAEAPALYGSHAIYVNLTESGSFDKTIIEAAACGAIVVCGNDALKGAVPATLFVEAISPEHAARAIETALALSPDERAEISRALRAWVERDHSLSLLIEQLVSLMQI